MEALSKSTVTVEPSAESLVDMPKGPEGRAKLSKIAGVALPSEVMRLYSRLPKNFVKRDLDAIVGEKISRDMKWRYLKRMQTLGLIKHSSKKRYEKLFESYSDWVLNVQIPKLKQIESSG